MFRRTFLKIAAGCIVVPALRWAEPFMLPKVRRIAVPVVMPATGECCYMPDIFGRPTPVSFGQVEFDWIGDGEPTSAEVHAIVQEQLALAGLQKP